MKFRREWEREQYLDEAREFIRTEVRYAARMASVYRADDDPRDASFLRATDAFIVSLKRALEATPPDSPQTTRLLRSFPVGLLDLTTAIFQRRETSFPRPFTTPATQTNFAPSEVALDFPLTIRAAEAINEQYHRRVEGFYDAWPNCAAPLVNLSGGSIAGLQINPDLAHAAGGNDTAKTCAHLLNLSCVKLPRWSSQHIRTFAFAAHEHLHRIFWLIEVARTKIQDDYAKNADGNSGMHPDSVIAESDETMRAAGIRRYAMLLDQERPKLGGRLCDLHNFCHQFAFQFRTFFFQYAIPSPRGVAMEIIEPLRTAIAWRHMIEILADTGATVIAGPAFLFAYRTAFRQNAEREEERMRKRDFLRNGSFRPSLHPPTSVRIQLQIEVLKELGFVTLGETFDEDLKEDNALQGASYGLIEAYKEFVKAPDFRRSLSQFISIIAETAWRSDPTPCYDLIRTNQKEDKVLDDWLALANRVEGGGDFYVEDAQGYTAVDLINAIWIKRLHPYDHGPKNKLAWRASLRNHFRMR